MIRIEKLPSGWWSVWIGGALIDAACTSREHAERVANKIESIRRK